MNKELLLVVDGLSREKNVEKQIVFSALESAISSATKKKLNDQEIDIEITIDRDSGSFKTVRRWLVVEDSFKDTEDFSDKSQIIFSEAKKINSEINVDEFITENIESPDFGRIGAMAAKQVIVQKIREAERNQILKDFLDRNESILYGTIRKIDRFGAIIETGKLESFLPRDQMIPRENLRVGDKIKAFVSGVETTNKGSQLFISRNSPNFLINLFENEVPEIEEGILFIKSAARDPGSRSKIAVFSNDKRIDPIGTCVGMRGSRVQAVTNELSGERVDIVLWSEDDAQFVINSLAPSEVLKISVDEEEHSMDIVVDENNLAQAIGRGGQNVRLASDLTGWSLNIISESESVEKENKEIDKSINLFVNKLEIDEEIANHLISQGYSSLEELAYISDEEFDSVENIEPEILTQIRNKARDLLLLDAMLDDTEESDINLITSKTFSELDENVHKLLADANIKTLSDLADYSIDELQDVCEIDEDLAGKIIMQAREPFFENDKSSNA
jgi:N utilization substance protein A